MLMRRAWWRCCWDPGWRSSVPPGLSCLSFVPNDDDEFTTHTRSSCCFLVTMCGVLASSLTSSLTSSTWAAPTIQPTNQPLGHEKLHLVPLPLSQLLLYLLYLDSFACLPALLGGNQSFSHLYMTKTWTWATYGALASSTTAFLFHYSDLRNAYLFSSADVIPWAVEHWTLARLRTNQIAENPQEKEVSCILSESM